MVRVDGKDADALGETASPPAGVRAAPSRSSIEEGEPEEIECRVWDELRTCYDPEIPVDIVELGLVYGCQVTPLTDGGHQVAVTMTLTAPGCGMGHVLTRDIERKLRAVPGVRRASVDIVVDPPWDQSRMSAAARLQMGLL
jgi:probable FeS assembly SUF system protein SufT